MSAAETCFHCGLPVPAGAPRSLEVLGAERAFCCAGCREVAALICRAGTEDYYRHRTAPAAAASGAELSALLERLGLYDREDIQRGFVHRGAGWREASLLLEGVRCPACVWLNEQHLRALPGVLAVDMDYDAQRARVRWDPERTRLSAILRAIADLGYLAHPYDTRRRDAVVAEQRRRDGVRLLFAFALAMPVMQFSLATYLMGASGTELWESLGRWSMLGVTLVLLAYPGQDFYIGAWRDLRARRLGMDVPIVVGLSTAWLASLRAAWTGQGEVYLDSIGMFVVLVLGARHLEMRGRMRAADEVDRASRVMPEVVRRVGDDGVEETVAAADLAPGDRVRVRAGEAVPADGVFEADAVHGAGPAGFDESLLTGEAAPVAHAPGDEVIAGSIPRDGSVLLRVARVGPASSLGTLQRLLEQGLRSRPRAALLAERMVRWFVPAVLGLAGLTWLTAAATGAADALERAIAVLIVTCPCALALATPVALTVAAGRMAARGILPVRLAGIEALATAGVVALDKTGTLTRGRLEVVAEHRLGDNHPQPRAVAAALERHESHPVAAPLQAWDGPLPELTGHERFPGGVGGVVAGRRWRLGTPEAVLGADPPAPVSALIDDWRGSGRTVVVLAADGAPEALWGLADTAREGLEELGARLGALGAGRVAVLSGDRGEAVTRVAAAAGIPEALGALRPADKLAWIRERQAAGERVVMVGDGLNDAPTLAAADVSLAFTDASALARTHSDFLLLRGDLDTLPEARALARRTRRIILQNFAWALGYNALALPLAVLGFVPPWGAALGMSASSLVVVANALRLRQIKDPARAGGGEGRRRGHGLSLPLIGRAARASK